MGRQYYIDPDTQQKVYLPDYLTPIDNTLTQTGQAADAKATGDALATKGTYSKPVSGIPASDLASGVIPDISGKVSYTDKLSQITGSLSDAEKTTLWSRLTSIKTSMDAVAVAGAAYYLGTQSAVSVTLPSTANAGQEISVVFYSGSTATTLTVSTCLGDVPTPTANQRIELNFLWDGVNWMLLSNRLAVSA